MTAARVQCIDGFQAAYGAATGGKKISWGMGAAMPALNRMLRSGQTADEILARLRELVRLRSESKGREADFWRDVKPLPQTVESMFDRLVPVASNEDDWYAEIENRVKQRRSHAR